MFRRMALLSLSLLIALGASVAQAGPVSEERAAAPSLSGVLHGSPSIKEDIPPGKPEDSGNAVPNDAGLVTNYALTATSGTFTPLSGSTRVTAVETDDASSAAVPIGFTFWFMGVPYTQVWANSNGHLSFNSAAPTTSASNMRTNALTSAVSTLRPMVAPLWDDENGGATLGSVASYQTSGSPGSRVFTFEWLNWGWDWQATSAVISFQAKLYEATGAVEFVYRQETGTLSNTSSGASIGIATVATGAGNYLSLNNSGASPTASSTTDTTTIATKPATGQTYTFTPPAGTPNAPTGLSFTAVTASSMTLNWTDNASDEAGFTIFKSTDGVNYSFQATTAANATSYNATSLSFGTTYFWQVYAVKEGSGSSALTGSQATNPAGEISCNGAGGLWSSTATWTGGVLPTSSDNVTITDGCTVTIDTTSTINNLTVGQGTSGILQFETTTARTLTANGSVTIAAGGTLQSAATGTVTTHLLSVGTNLVVNGTLDLSTNANTAAAELRFAGAANNSWSGTGATADVRTVSLNKGAIGNTLEVTRAFTVRGAAATDTIGFLSTTTYTGTFKISGTGTYSSPVFTTAAYTIPSTGGLWLNNANFTVSALTGSPTLNGLLRVSAGTYNIGTATGNSMGFGSGSTVTVEGGAVNAAGRFGVASATNIVTYTQSGGTITVDTAGNTSTTLASFDLGTSASSSMSVSGGTIVVRLANTIGSGPRDYRAAPGLFNLTGGTLQFGDASSGAAKTFIMAASSTSVSSLFPNLVVSNASAGHTVQVATGPMLGLSATTNAGTTLNLGGFVFQVVGNVTNNGTITGTTTGSRLYMGGSLATTLSGTGTITTVLDGLSIDNPAGVTITHTNTFTVGRVNLFRGLLTNSNKVTIGNGGTTTGITQIGSAGLTSPGGNYDVAPTFNAGTGGYQVLYQQESVPRTSGLEIPGTRSLAAISVNNTNGVTLAGGGVSITSTLTLTAGLFNTSAANTPTLTTTVTTPPSGSATTYVNGPLAIQLNTGTNTSKTFGIGGLGGWRPVVLGAFHSNATLQTYTAEVIEGATGGTPNPPLTSLNPARYFRIQNSANVFSTTMATVQLSYGTGDTVPNTATARVAQANTAAGLYTSRGGATAASPTTGIVSNTAINPGDDFFVLGDEPPPAPPANDDCSAAATIGGAGPFPYLTTTVNLTSATTTGDPTFCAMTSHTAWYSFTPTVSATYTITSCQLSAPGTTATDTVVGIFTGASCAGPFTTTACNDNDSACTGGTSRSTVSAILAAGTSYYVVVGTAGAATPSPANVQLAVSRVLPPGNDNCSAPTSLSVNAPVSGTTAGAFDDYELTGSTCFTSQGQLVNTATTAPGRDVVYSFTAPSNGKYSFRITNSTGGDPVLYTASSCDASTFPTPVVVGSCVSAANRKTLLSEEVTCQTMTAGQTVYAIVDEVASAGAPFTIEVNPCDQESGSNDTPATANPLACGKEGTIPAGDTDFYTLGSPGAGWRLFAMIDGIPSLSADTRLRLTNTTDVYEFDDDDGDTTFGASGFESVISGGVLPAGQTYLSVSGFSGTTVVEPYRLYSVLEPPLANAVTETEPNDAAGTANSSAGNYFKGTLSALADVDTYAFTASAGDLVLLGLDCDSNRDGTAVDGILTLLAPDGTTTLVSVNGSTTSETTTPNPGVGLTATTPSWAGEGLVYRIRTSGTYYARVTESTTATTTDYALSISSNCAIPPADLAVSQGADVDPVATGSNVTYTVTVTNNGPNTAWNAKLTDSIPANMSFVSVTVPGGWSCGAPSGGQIVCTASSLAPSGSANLQFTYAAAYCTGNVQTTHTSVASSDTPDAVPSNNSSSLLSNISDSGSCSDNNACTTGDTCVGSVCVGGPPPSCTDGDACTADSCNTGTGLCEHHAITCNDNNSCTDDTCDSGSGCVYTNNNANACSDNDACTSGDHCVAGSCTGTAVTCDDGNVCTTDSCTPGTGACVHANTTNSCDDSDACTSGDQCGPALSQNFDGVTAPAIPSGWTTTLVTGSTGDGPFATVGTGADTAPNAAFANDPDHITDKVLDSPAIPIASASAQLTFRHKYTLESTFDGAVLEIKIGAGPFTDFEAAGGTFGAGSDYDATISTDYNSPIQGRGAWSGTKSSYATVTATLPASAAGQTVVLRWRVATDQSVNATGYWVDTILLIDSAYSCHGGSPVTCNDSNVCTVDSCNALTGCVYTAGNSGTLCRPSSGLACDPAEFCDGVNPNCPPDSVNGSTAIGNSVLLAWSSPTVTISWPGEPNPAFNVYRGFRPSGGPWSYNHTCTANNLSGTSTTDATSLAADELFYYLVSRRTAPCTESSLGQDSNAAERPNTSPCP